MAVEVAAKLSEEGQPVAFVDLSARSGPDSVLPCVAAGLGVDVNPGRDLLGAVVASVDDDGVLVVLDTCERLRAACAAVAHALIGACGGLRVLAISRQRLGAAGERCGRCHR